jgi:hypothetical protein
VNAFWGAGEAAFPQHLERREITNFCRAISDIIDDDRDMSQDCVKVLNMDELEAATKGP